MTRDEHTTNRPIPGGSAFQETGMGDYLTRVAEAVRSACFEACNENGGDMGAICTVDLPAVIASVPRPEPVAWAHRVTDTSGNRLPGWKYADDAGSIGLRSPLYAETVAAQPAVPDGWKMVPVEPTIAMCIAGDRARLNVDDPTRTPPIYRAMLAAAPEAPQPDDDDFELTCPEPPARDDRKAIKRLSDAVSEICFQSSESEDEFTKWLADGGMLELLESSIKAMKLEKAVEAAGQQNAALQSELLTLYQGYVNQLESGRDKIIALGGDCDQVDVMERNDPWLISARKVLASTKGGAA